MEAVREEPLRSAEVRVRGDLIGKVQWTLVDEDPGTRLLFEETVATGKAFLNIPAPLFTPFFARTHTVMRRRG